MGALLEFAFGWEVLSLSVSIFLFAGGILVSEFKRYSAAQACFYVVALLICGKVIMWSVRAPENFYLRSFVVFVVCGLVAVGVAETSRLISRKARGGSPGLLPDQKSPV